MGMLVNGEWRTDIKEKNHETDSFNQIIEKGSTFEPEENRYHLYISRACPWAHRAALLRQLRGLEHIISIDIVDPVRHDEGWEFSPEKENCTEDSQNGFDYLREIYQKADANYTGRVTVPVLWDKKEETIVNNESEEIARMINNSFRELGNNIDLYPENLQDEIDSTIRTVYNHINAGVYKAGFAEKQEDYENAVRKLFEQLEKQDQKLEDQRFLLGDKITLADIFMFPTLFRFDAVYHTHFKCNIQKITEFNNLWKYTRDIYQKHNISRTCNLNHVKQHYYRSHLNINPTGFVPVGPELDFDQKNKRDTKSDMEEIFFRN
jgi:putative glutathione S-transferase